MAEWHNITLSDGRTIKVATKNPEAVRKKLEKKYGLSGSSGGSSSRRRRRSSGSRSRRRRRSSKSDIVKRRRKILHSQNTYFRNEKDRLKWMAGGELDYDPTDYNSVWGHKYPGAQSPRDAMRIIRNRRKRKSKRNNNKSYTRPPYTRPPERKPEDKPKSDNMINIIKNGDIRRYFRHQPKTYDRTEMVRKALNDPNITKATLYVDYSTVLGSKFAGYKEPPERKPEEIVKGWLEGWELARQAVPFVFPWGGRGNKYYWVKYPAKLTIERKTDSAERKTDSAFQKIPVIGDVMNDPYISQIFVIVIAGVAVHFITQRK